MLAQGSVFAADYRVDRVKSSGGMGSVYIVEQLSTGRHRALKLMHPDLVKDPKLRERFAQEARVGSRIDSDHVVEVIAAGVEGEDQVPFIVMELLEGPTLTEHLASRRSLSPAEVDELFSQLCHALGAAHASGIVHRDIKPDNIVLSAARRANTHFTVKVLDFGIAKLVAEAKTVGTSAMGTPLWMAPEQSEVKARITPASDVWPLGLIAFRALTGSTYWKSAEDDGASMQAVMREILFDPIGSASERAREVGAAALPEGFDAWFARCVHRDASQRFQDARAAYDALHPILARPAAVAVQPHHVSQQIAAVSPAPSRSWLAVGLVGAALVAAAGTGGYFLFSGSGTKRSRATIDEEETPPPARSARESASAVAPAPEGPPKPVTVELYVMAQCPYCAPFEHTLKEVRSTLGPEIDLHVDYVGVDSGGTLSSMHGADEVKGDLAQVCAMKLSPLWLDFVVCQSDNQKDVATTWRSCGQASGVPADKLEACMNGPEGQELLRASFARAEARKVEGAPTLYIGGKQYAGERKKLAVLRAVCEAHDAPAPKQCSMGDAPVVNLTILGDKRCTEDACTSGTEEKEFTAEIRNPKLRRLDVASPEGQALYASLKPLLLPAAVFDGTLGADPDAETAIGKSLRPSGSYRVRSLGEWNPECADPGGCALSQCAKTTQCRPETPNKLELFVMSKCPYGTKALVSMQEVLAHFKKSGAAFDFSIDYIGTGDRTALSSMHGPTEVEEDIRQVCAIKRYDKDFKFMNYIACRAGDFRNPDWRKCTGGTTGIEPEVLQRCAETDGPRLLEESFARSSASGMNASPSWFVNGKYKFSGFDAPKIESELCAHNRLAGCPSP